MKVSSPQRQYFHYSRSSGEQDRKGRGAGHEAAAAGHAGGEERERPVRERESQIAESRGAGQEARKCRKSLILRGNNI